MTEPTPIYESPVSQPVTPPFETDEGYPVPPAVTTTLVLKNIPSGFPDVREVKRFKEIAFYDGADPATFAQVEGGRFNETRRMIYRAYQRFARFLFLHIGIVDWEASPVFAADYDVEGSPTALLGKAWEFDAANVAGVGNENLILITWTDADAGTPSINNARALARVSDGKALSSIQIGDMVVDQRAGEYGQAQILDIEYHGAAGDDHTATLTLNKPLLAAREDKVWIARSNLQYNFPPLSLNFEAAVCKHAIRREDNTFPSYKIAYPSEYVVDGIDGVWHCAKMNDSDALLSEFEAFCSNTSCPVYSVHVPYLPLAYDIGEWWLSRGWYLKEVSITGGGASSNFRKGLENFPGILQLGGVLNGFDVFSNRLRSKDSMYLGVLKWATGNTTADGYTEFLDFAAIQVAREATSSEADAGTFLDVFTSGPDKYDPAGGLSSASRLLVDDADRTPGNDLSKRMGVRRIITRTLSQDEMDEGMSYADKGTIAGLGTGDVQRVRPVRRTSYPFTLGVVNTLRGTRTLLDSYATPQTLPASGEAYDVSWIVPRYSDNAKAPQTRLVKNSVTGVAANISFDGNFMTVEFAMTDYDLSRPNTLGQPDIVDTASMGGGYVVSDLAHVIRNPGDGSGVQYMGDPENKIYPGDMIFFDVEAIRDIGITCVSAKAFSGSVDAAAVAPHASAPGVPEYVRTNYAKRDVAIFHLSPENGEAIRQYVVSVGASEQAIPIDYVAHSAVAPPIVDADLNPTGYAPTLKKTYKTTGATTTVPTNEYVWEPNTGGFYIDTTGWAAGDYVLFTQMWVFDARKIYPCSISSAYASLVDDLCELYYETSLDLTQAGFELLADTAPETLGPSFELNHDVVDGDVPPYVPWTLASADFFVVQLTGGGPASITRTYMSPATPATNSVGAITGGFFNKGNWLDSFHYSNTVQAYSFSTLDDIGRWRSDDFEEARIEISFS